MLHLKQEKNIYTFMLDPMANKEQFHLPEKAKKNTRLNICTYTRNEMKKKKCIRRQYKCIFDM